MSRVICVRILRTLLGAAFLLVACFMMAYMAQVRAWVSLHAYVRTDWLGFAWVLPLLSGYLGFDLLLGRRPLASSLAASVLLATSLTYFIRVASIVGDSQSSGFWPGRTPHPALVIGANAACLIAALIVLTGVRAPTRIPKAR